MRKFYEPRVIEIYSHSFEQLFQRFSKSIARGKEAEDICNLSSSNYEKDISLLLSLLQCLLYSMPIYCVEFRCFMNWVESYFVSIAESEHFSFHDNRYQAFSSFLHTVYPNLYFEVFTKLTRKMEPSIVKSMFPLCVEFPLSPSVGCREMQTALGFFGKMIGESSQMDELLICSNRMLSVACEIVGGSSSYISTVACIILALQLLHKNTNVLSCKYMMELSDFIIRFETIYRNFCKTSSKSQITQHIKDAYKLIVEAHCGPKEDHSSNMQQNEETLWNWMWNMISGQKQHSSEIMKHVDWPYVFPEVCVESVKDIYFVAANIETYNEASLIMFSISEAVEGASSLNSIASIALVVLSLLESVHLKKFIVSHLHGVIQQNETDGNIPSGRYFSSHVESYVQFRAHKVAQQLRVQKSTRNFISIAERASTSVLAEVVTEQYLRRLVESEVSCGYTCDGTQYFELIGEYYGSECNSTSISNKLSDDLKWICAIEDIHFYSCKGKRECLDKVGSDWSV